MEIPSDSMDQFFLLLFIFQSAGICFFHTVTVHYETVTMIVLLSCVGKRERKKTIGRTVELGYVLLVGIHTQFVTSFFLMSRKLKIK